jgi:hypothetical protein
MIDDYKQGYRDGFKDGMKAVKEQNESAFPVLPTMPKCPVCAIDKNCPVCGIDFTRAMGYVCYNASCPTPRVSY